MIFILIVIPADAHQSGLIRLAIPACWKIGESKNLGVFSTKQKQNSKTQNNHNRNKQETQEDTQETR